MLYRQYRQRTINHVDEIIATRHDCLKPRDIEQTYVEHFDHFSREYGVHFFQ